MKKISFFLTLFVFVNAKSQTYFQTSSNSLTSNSDITHFGSLVIGSNNLGYIPNPWLPYNDVLLEIDNKNKGVALNIKNDWGRLQLAVSHVNGAYYPISKRGDVVIRKSNGANIIFSLNNIANNGNNAFIFGDNLNHKTLTILNNGRVGIGTLTPDTELAVNGTIHSKEVKVDLDGWSDFVFKDGYKLPSLKDVEKFIKKNGHLKGIPSEKEVLKNGINLGEINSKLLQKIEELTLYIIRQQKEIELLKKIEPKKIK